MRAFSLASCPRACPSEDAGSRHNHANNKPARGPEKWTPIFPREKFEGVCAKIMLIEGIRSLPSESKASLWAGIRAKRPIRC